MINEMPEVITEMMYVHQLLCNHKEVNNNER